MSQSSTKETKIQTFSILNLNPLRFLCSSMANMNSLFQWLRNIKNNSNMNEVVSTTIISIHIHLEAFSYLVTDNYIPNWEENAKGRWCNCIQTLELETRISTTLSSWSISFSNKKDLLLCWCWVIWCQSNCLTASITPHWQIVITTQG